MRLFRWLFGGLLMLSLGCSPDNPEPEGEKSSQSQPQPSASDSLPPRIDMLDFDDRVAAGESLKARILFTDNVALDTLHGHLENINREFSSGRLKHNKVGTEWDTTLPAEGQRQEISFEIPIDSNAFAGPYLMELEAKDRAGHRTTEDRWMAKVTNPEMPLLEVDFEGAPVFPDLKQGQQFRFRVTGRDPDADLFRFYVKAPRGGHQHVHHGSVGEIADSAVFAFDRLVLEIPWQLGDHYAVDTTLQIAEDAPPGDYQVVFIVQDWVSNQDYRRYGFHVLEK